MAKSNPKNFANLKPAQVKRLPPDERFEYILWKVARGDLKTRPQKWEELTAEQKERYTKVRQKVDPGWRNPDQKLIGRKKGDPVPPAATPETRKRKGPICGANRKGRSDSGPGICCMPAGAGTDHLGVGACWRHGGRTPGHTIKAVREAAMQKMVIYGSPKDVDPDTAVMQELARTAGHVEWLRQRIEDLEDPEKLKEVSAFGVGPNFWLKLYKEERAHLVTVGKTAKAMGISERQTRILEEQGKMLAMAFMKFMEHPMLDLNPLQKAHAKTVAREVLLAIDIESKELPSGESTATEAT